MDEQQLIIEKEIVEKINEQTGFDEEIIGCWYCNFGGPICALNIGGRWCKNTVKCNNLEGRYTGG